MCTGNNMDNIFIQITKIKIVNDKYQISNNIQ